MAQPELHPACLPLVGLVGTWKGSGRGFYPTIEKFDYEEEATFGHVGKPFLAYSQKTWSPDAGSPLHSETGYWRPQDGGRIELVLAHPFGYAEVSVGTYSPGRIEVSATALVPTPSAKDITEVTRVIEFDSDTLRYWVAMAAAGQPLQAHLEATLQRVSS